MKHQPWDPISAKAKEPVGSVKVENEHTDWQSDLLVLSAFIQGFSEEMSEILREIQRAENVSGNRSAF